ncbi:tRNA (5-methylaminomethyl-2-thiouridylate)-methyltransferase [Candidatus Nitrosocosmicus sp. SS]|uniref:tRNA (5-methylaminomethyl-2-thiouridylate)-methyltransferase n=1 Tax=Candidatus Nitrosocosmicus agrestis TaxID=2563600 RepID=UPI001E64FC65|nr:tRNA (5-methylaminomethyl-2-thiouridylate)-methyltransferase [Candidatus Nitrosocosmicus sp. SS]
MSKISQDSLKNDEQKINEVNSVVDSNTQENSKVKAVALLSGGLDSQLAVRMIKEQGIEVEAVAIKTPFCDFDCGKGCGHKVLEVATELDIKLKTVFLGKDYLKMLKNPKYGYGSGMNPCIDCRMMMYDEAKKHMKKIGATFLITGEVLHQRPMSQNSNALSIIEKNTEMEGKVLRPLSAKLMPPTEPEARGLVKRSLLGSIRGRSRRGQLELANNFGIEDPPNSAGGCLLTDPEFSKRVRDLFRYSITEPSLNDMELLKIGRHFRMNSESKLIVGRNHGENEMLKSLGEELDYILQPTIVPGPVSILRFHDKPDLRKHKLLLECSSKITLRYSDTLEDRSYEVSITNQKRKLNRRLYIRPFTKNDVESFRI